MRFNDAHIEIEDLKNIDSTEFYKVKSIPMWEIEAKEFIDFYNTERTNRYGIGGTLPAEFSHEYNKICHDGFRRVITIGYDGDRVIVIIKRVQMFKHIYNRIEGLPISMGGNKCIERCALTEIAGRGLATKISALEGESECLKQWGFEFSEKVEAYNYYSHIPTNFAHINKNKWKHKKGIKRMLAMKNLTMNFLQDQNTHDLQDIQILNDGFDKYKKEIQKVPKGWHRLQKSMSKYPYWTDNNVVCYMFKYKDIPVAFVVYILVNGHLTHQIINKTIGRNLHAKPDFRKKGFLVTAEEFADYQPIKIKEKEEFEEVKKRISAFVHYKTIEDMVRRGVMDGYFGGAFGEDGRTLRTYKSIMNDHEIEHYIHKLA